MDIEQYQQQIVEIVQEATGALYTEKIEVRFDEPDLWSLFLYLDRELVPLILSYQGDFEQFKKYIVKELKARQLTRVGFYKIDLVYNGCKNECNE